LRLVWGLGTRAVDRVSDDYPRLVSLSHPRLRPETSAAAIRRYSQHHIDVIDLEANEMVTLPVQKVIEVDYPFLRFIASEHKEDYIQELVSAGTIDKLPLPGPDLRRIGPGCQLYRNDALGVG
jgi:hypothetical protein